MHLAVFTLLHLLYRKMLNIENNDADHVFKRMQIYLLFSIEIPMLPFVVLFHDLCVFWTRNDAC